MLEAVAREPKRYRVVGPLDEGSLLEERIAHGKTGSRQELELVLENLPEGHRLFITRNDQ